MMNKRIAAQLLSEEMAVLRQRSYDALRDEFLARPSTKELVGPDGKRYQVEVQGFWDDKAGRDLRVVVSIDDGRGWRMLCPLTDSFIMSPTGDLVGE